MKSRLKLRRVLRMFLTVSCVGLSLLGLKLGWSVYRYYSLDTEVTELKERKDELTDWILDLEEEILGSGITAELPLDRLVPTELDVTSVTELMLRQVARLDLRSFQYQLAEPTPWEGPVIEGHQVLCDRFTLSFDSTFEVLRTMTEHLVNLDRLVKIDRVSVSRFGEGRLQVSLTFEAFRRVPWTGGIS